MTNGDGVLLTPAVDHGALPGITRSVVLDLAAANHIEAVEAAVTPARLATVAEAFLTNSLIGVRPLVAMDGAIIGGGVPGPVTQLIGEAHAATLRR